MEVTQHLECQIKNYGEFSWCNEKSLNIVKCTSNMIQFISGKDYSGCWVENGLNADKSESQRTNTKTAAMIQ